MAFKPHLKVKPALGGESGTEAQRIIAEQPTPIEAQRYLGGTPK